MKGLSPERLTSLDDVAVPAYDRSKVTVGIVHFGVGNFHRSHQAMFLDSLMNRGEALDWGICGVGVLPTDLRMREALARQSGLYTLVMKHADGRTDARVIGSIIDYLYAPEDREAVLERLAHPGTRIVSLTITEGGYGVPEPDDAAGSDVVPGFRFSPFVLIAEALQLRIERGLEPFTVLSCDNIEKNVDVAKQRVIEAARKAAIPGLESWIGDHVSFPNSMVDRITPATTDVDRALVSERFHLIDTWPVVCEPFVQWVLEDDFSAGRPAYEKAGVELVDDVTPYELMKLRLLNASHQAIAYFGSLLGFTYAHEAVGHPSIAALMRDYMRVEATPTLLPVPRIDLDEYQESLLERFANPEIRDTLARLATDASERIPKWVLPVIRENLAAGRSIAHATAVVASWARYCAGNDENGRPLTQVDVRAEELRLAARSSEPAAFLALHEIFGELAEDQRFASAFASLLATIRAHGAEPLLRRLADEVAAPSGAVR